LVREKWKVESEKWESGKVKLINMKTGKNKEFLPFGKTEDGLSQFDIYQPTIGHFNRFQAKLEKQEVVQKPKTNWYKYIAVAASLLLLITIGIGSINTKKGFDLADVSPKMEETQDYFTKVIHQEIEKVNTVKNSENEKIINDAFEQLQLLENNYENQKIALSTNTENKNIIYAMINNYQQRIEVLQNLLDELNRFHNIKNKYNENNTL